MTKKLHHYSEEEQTRAFSASNDPTVGAKGTIDNPYTLEEFEAMLEAGTWGGGYVGNEYIPAETTLPGVTITPGGSSSYGGEDNWYCPLCGHPYPADAGSDYVKCSNCGTSLEPKPTTPTLPGGGGGGGNSGGGTGGSTGGGNQSNKSNFRMTPEGLTEAANKTVQHIISTDEEGEVSARCNQGVSYMFKQCCNSDSLDNMLANQMVDYLGNSPDWQKVPISEVQGLANEGYFVIAGWKNPVAGLSGHVAVAVPGKASY
ncbi:MAG: hypothetical protein ACOYJE_01280 [Bacteroidaceae bacterium]